MSLRKQSRARLVQLGASHCGTRQLRSYQVQLLTTAVECKTKSGAALELPQLCDGPGQMLCNRVRGPRCNQPQQHSPHRIAGLHKTIYMTFCNIEARKIAPNPVCEWTSRYPCALVTSEGLLRPSNCLRQEHTSNDALYTQ